MEFLLKKDWKRKKERKWSQTLSGVNLVFLFKVKLNIWNFFKWQVAFELYIKCFILVRRNAENLFFATKLTCDWHWLAACYNTAVQREFFQTLPQYMCEVCWFFFFQLRSYYYKVSQLRKITHVLGGNKSSRTVLTQTLGSFAGSYYPPSHNTDGWNRRRGWATHFKHFLPSLGQHYVTTREK